MAMISASIPGAMELMDEDPHFPGSTELRSRRSEFSITRIHFGTASLLFGTASLLFGTAPMLFGTAPMLFRTASMLFGSAPMLFGSAPLNADLGGEPGGAHHALPRILKLVKTCSPLLVVISLLEILTATSSCCDDRI